MCQVTSLDTDVVAYCVLHDGPRQSPLATRVNESLSDLRSKALLVERAELVAQASKRNGAEDADFANALIERLAASAGCATTVNFDADAAKAASMILEPSNHGHQPRPDAQRARRRYCPQGASTCLTRS